MSYSSGISMEIYRSRHKCSERKLFYIDFEKEEDKKN